MKKKNLFIAIMIVLIVLIGGIVSLKMLDTNTKTYTNPDDIPFKDPLLTKEYFDSDDEDKDGLSNKEEKELGTSLIKRDTDGDSISDYIEVKEQHTDPLNPDTDGDTLNDGCELALNLNPLNKKTDKKTADKKRNFTLDFAAKEGTLNINGNANIASTNFEIVDFIHVGKTPGVIGNMYEYYQEDAKIKNASISIAYKEKDLKAKGYKTDNLSIYKMLNNGTFQEVKSTVNKKECTVTARISKPGKYLLADKTILNSDITSKVYILLDNSGSMYPKEIVSASGENDVNFKRVDMAKELIQKCGDDIQFGAGKFTATYTPLSEDFSSSEKKLITALESIKTTEEDFNGTYIAKSIKSALDCFEKSDNSSRKFIVLLTDGETTESGWLYDENDAIEDANQKNVSIIVIGLGNGVDTEYLTKIANGTGGMYVYANNSDALDKVYDAITAGLNYNLTDTDNDGKNDSILIADTGFDVTKDAICFDNYVVHMNYADSPNFGQCYGIAAFTQKQYLGKVKLKEKGIDPFIYSCGLFGINKYNFECDAYDLSDIEFFANTGKYANNKNNLKEYSFYKPYLEIMDIENKYIRSKDNPDMLIFTDEVRKMIEDDKMLSVVIHEHKNSPATWSVDKKEYTSEERVCLNLNVDIKSLTDEETDTYNFLLMLHHYYLQQCLETADEYNIRYSSLISGETQDEAINTLITDLKNGIIPIVSGEGHAVNAVSLYRNIDNPSEYTLYIYDNNDHNILKRIRIVKEKIGFSIDASDWTSGGYDYTIYDMDGAFIDDSKEEINVNFEVLR